MKETKAKDALAELRAAIDAIDDELLRLIQKRAELAAEVGRHKRTKKDAPFYVPSREAEIVRRILARHRRLAQGLHAPRLPDEAVHAIFRQIIGACLALEHPLTVAYLGPDGTFSSEAARRHFGNTGVFHACSSLEEVFDEVCSGRASYGVVPVENAFEGSVGRTLDLLAEMDEGVRICAEVMLGIRHQLLSVSDTLAAVERVYSHPQALAQCRRWLDAHLPQAVRVDVASTAAAAERAKREGPQAAAIAPLSVAERLGMNVLAANIEDQHGNTTRFFVLGPHDARPSGDDRTTLLASVRDEPGALFELLRPFAERGVSLSKIESRPSRRRPWEYIFFIDAEGHRDQPPLCDALAELERRPGVQLRVLGSYPKGVRL